MRWKGERQSTNVEDRRGMSTGKKVVGGGIGTLVIAVIIILLGGDPQSFLQNLGGGTQTEDTRTSTIELTEHQKEMGQFVSVVLGYTEDVWGEIFKQNGLEYRQPKLVLFSGNIESACGYAAAATGPFYCPSDEKVYIDLDFLEKLQDQLGAQGDFAAAYIIAHEVGHHVQNLLGTLDKANEEKRGLSEAEANKISVRVELQADFLAGIWAHYAQQMKNILEEGDIQEAMNAAEAVGDDRLQKQSQGYVVPDSFTHGTSKQREAWFMKGFKTGDISKGEI
jgi:uncharacterized protein